jgi:hypothetical protein
MVSQFGRRYTRRSRSHRLLSQWTIIVTCPGELTRGERPSICSGLSPDNAGRDSLLRFLR